ncbi:MAG TPA: CmcI family methyltransferase [Spongiibacteraceae bacterium]|nr:CmcI family methyltransferase [Spongiibacteraceae bacterium]
MAKPEHKVGSINWLGNGRFTVGDLHFIARNIDAPDTESSLSQFFVMKPGKLVRQYEKLIESIRPQHILELGVFKGGSCIFFHALACAKKHVALELSKKRIDIVDQYVEAKGLEDSLKIYYGVNQADSETVVSIVQKEFNGSLDFVVDDASHFLDESRASFNAIFPHVVPGGAYVIEDWSWGHTRPAAHVGEMESEWHADKEPLTKLIFEIIMACPSTEGLIERIEVDRFKVVVWRGEKEIVSDGFDVRKCLSQRSRSLIA